jgi:hypothetical protein
MKKGHKKVMIITEEMHRTDLRLKVQGEAGPDQETLGIRMMTLSQLQVQGCQVHQKCTTAKTKNDQEVSTVDREVIKTMML